MAFIPKKGDSGKAIPMLTAASTTITVGDGLECSSGYLQRVTTAKPQFIALEAKVTAAATHYEILVVPVDKIDEIEVDTTGDMAQSYVGTKVTVTDHATIDEDDTSSGYFLITGIVGATTAKKARGLFVPIS